MTGHHSIDSVKTYVFVFLALIAATVATTAVAFVDLGSFSVVMALACRSRLWTTLTSRPEEISRLAK